MRVALRALDPTAGACFFATAFIPIEKQLDLSTTEVNLRGTSLHIVASLAQHSGLVRGLTECDASSDMDLVASSQQNLHPSVLKLVNLLVTGPRDVVNSMLSFPHSMSDAIVRSRATVDFLDINGTGRQQFDRNVCMFRQRVLDVAMYTWSDDEVIAELQTLIAE